MRKQPMPKVTVKAPSFDVVAANSTSTLRCPIGRTYEKSLVSYVGTTFDLSHMTEIRIVGNGKVIDRFAPARGLSGGQILDEMNQYEGRAAANGVLAIDYGRYGLRTRVAEEATGLGTGVKPVAKGQPGYDEYIKAGGTGVELSTLAIEVDLGAVSADAKMTVKSHQSDPKPLGMIKKVRRFGYTPGGSGDYEISDIPKGDLINKIYFHNNQINSLRVQPDNDERFNRTKAENELIQIDGDRVPQAGMFVFDTSEEGYGSEGLVTKGVQDLRFVLDMAAAGSVPVDVEYIGPMDR